MRFRKAIVFILCAIMTFSLVACGKKDPGSGGGKTPGGTGGSTTCTVTYDVGAEAKAAGVTNPAPVKVDKGGKVTSLPTVSWDSDHTFVKWMYGGEEFTVDTVVNSDITVTASWDDSAMRNQYESTLAANGLAKPGHLYIHYKRYGHTTAIQGLKNSSAAPTYNDPIPDTVYSDWGLWLWPKNNEGRLFYPERIDVSGAVYDVLLDYDYNDAGWDATKKEHKGLHANYVKMPNAKGEDEDVTSIGMLLFQVSTRKLEGHWKSDGGNNYLDMKTITRDGGDAHWYVTEGGVTTGSAQFGTGELGPDPYANDDGSFVTRATGDKMINSAATSSYPQVKDRVKGFDANNGYQIFIASFKDSDGDGMGDIRGIIEELDYLDRLGVDILWLTPFQTSTNYHGYDIKDFFSVDSRFGTDADYRELVYKVHKKGMRIVMDFVLNHTSQANPWFVKSQNLKKEKAADGSEIDYRQFYSWINKDKYDHLSEDEKKQWHGDAHGYYFYSSFSADQPELNYDYQPVRDAILDVCNYWMAYGLDGFRLDAVKHIYMVNEIEPVGKTPSGAAGTAPGAAVIKDGLYSHDVNRNINFYREFNYKLKKNYPNAFVVGENLDGYNLRTARYYEGIDSQFEFNTYYAGRGFAAIREINKVDKKGNLAGGKLNESSMGSAFADYIRGYKKFKEINPGFIGGQFTSNHDLPRARNRMALSGSDGSETDRYADIANGTDKKLIDDSYNALYLYYGMLMTLPGVTWTYYGDEIGMLGVMETTVKTGSTDTVKDAIDHEDRIYRQPMKWTETGNASYSIGFNDAKCELTGYNLTGLPSATKQETNKSTSLWGWVQELNKLRKQYKLGAATNITDNGSGGNKIAYKVTCGNGQTLDVTIVANGSVSTSGAKATKTVTINGKSCTVVIK